METFAQTQEQIDTDELRVRIARLGKYFPSMRRRPYSHLAQKFDKAESTVTAAMNGCNDTLLPKIVHYVEYLERKASEKESIAQSMRTASEVLRGISDRSRA